jgi:Xaa-Pro dipeptidase
VDTRIGAERIARLRSAMREHGIDVLLCLQPQNSYYLSGFNPIIYSHPVVAVLPQEGEPMLLVHALRDDHARDSAWVKDVRLFGAWSTKQTLGPDWLAALRVILDEREVSRGIIGIEDQFLPIGVMQQLEKRLPDARFVNASELILAARLVKEPSEIERIRAASVLADIGVEAAIAAAAERRSEREISIRAMAAMNQAWLERYPQYEVADFGSLEGGIQNGLWCYCLVGDRVAMNCDNPTLRVPKDGELMMIVTWTNCDGLHAENERTVAIGTLDDVKRRAYDALLEIRAETQMAIRPGITCAELYHVARHAYERLGYGRYLPGRIGHGLGLGAHEHPSLGPSDQTILEPNMVFTFEPNLRIPEFGGLQHSDTFMVTDTGYEFFTRTRRDFIQV